MGLFSRFDDKGRGAADNVFLGRDGFCVICANKDLGGRGLENWLKGYFIIFAAHLKACGVFFLQRAFGWILFLQKHDLK